MKKILLLALFTFSFQGFSQISLSRHSGAPINDGQVVAFNTHVFPASEMDFYVRNNSTTTSTNVKIRCEQLVNNDGTGFELCFGTECLSYVEEGEAYPSIAVTLAPNGQNGNFDHFLNTNPGSGTFPKDYVFRFYQIGAGGVEIGNSITMTYRYDPSLSNDEVNQLQTNGVIVKSTVVENNLELDVLKSSTMEIYDLSGKMVNNTKLVYGVQSIDVSNLATGAYIIKFKNTQENYTGTQKFIKM